MEKILIMIENILKIENKDLSDALLTLFEFHKNIQESSIELQSNNHSVYIKIKCKNGLIILINVRQFYIELFLDEFVYSMIPVKDGVQVFIRQLNLMTKNEFIIKDFFDNDQYLFSEIVWLSAPFYNQLSPDFSNKKDKRKNREKIRYTMD